jgi:hypothetical protein
VPAHRAARSDPVCHMPGPAWGLGANDPRSARLRARRRLESKRPAGLRGRARIEVLASCQCLLRHVGGSNGGLRAPP